MKLKFHPCNMETTLTASLYGDVIILNEEHVDFSPLPEGAILPNRAVNNPWIISDIERVDGDICLTLLIPHGQNAPEETLYPENFSQYKKFYDGDIPLPPYEVLI